MGTRYPPGTHVILKVSAWEISNIKWGFAKKVMIKVTKKVYVGPIYACTTNVNRQTTDKLLFSYPIITGENV